MMHISMPSSEIEIIESTISPLISKCQIKVCYVGEQPNRNSTIITKEVAAEMGKHLPGSPIVGFYNPDIKDFEGHNQELVIDDNGEICFVDVTRPYGFVDVNAKVWFQKFIDDNSIEREYLVTEGYIWTGSYPEAERIISTGNNQSMELNEKSVHGTWSIDGNSGKRFFIINEALIERLCILGENTEPCFEGAQVKSQFSLKESFEEFTKTMYSMINELKEVLNEGGLEASMNENEIVQAEEIMDEIVEETNSEIEEIVVEEEIVSEDVPAEAEVAVEVETEEVETEAEVEVVEEIVEEAIAAYNLDEIPEYAELLNRFSELSSQLEQVTLERDNLINELEPLKAFKLEAERKDKQAMINSFYMLSDEDKKEVRENIDSYSIDDIEAKLSVICVRNRVSFNLEEEIEHDDKPTTTFNLNEVNEELDNAPAWVTAVKRVASNM